MCIIWKSFIKDSSTHTEMNQRVTSIQWKRLAELGNNILLKNFNKIQKVGQNFYDFEHHFDLF